MTFDLNLNTLVGGCTLAAVLYVVRTLSKLTEDSASAKTWQEMHAKSDTDNFRTLHDDLAELRRAG